MQAPEPIKTFALGHDDFVHDVAYDAQGRRLASVSTDQRIRIWKKNKKTGEWKRVSELTGQSGAGGGATGHSAAIWKVKWADPQFGRLLATGSYDKQVIIWEETEKKEKNQRQWVSRHKFPCKDAVMDIGFAPAHWGLQIAISLQNGNVEIHECKDVLNLTSWQCIADFKTNSSGCNCLSWSPAFDEHPMLVVGCSDFNISAEPE